MNSRLAILAVLAAVSLPSRPALALGFRVPDQNATALARGNAFAATADNPSAIYYNPAGISQLAGTEMLLGAYAITFNSRIQLDAPGSNAFDNKYDPAVVPQTFSTFRIPKTAVTVGFGVYSPFGLKIKYADDVPFRQIAKEGRIEYITYNPVVAVQLTRTLSVAAGVTINQGEAELVRGIFARGDEFRFEGNDTAIGMNAGILYQPHRMHSIGISYFSPTSLDFDGESHTKFDAVVAQVQVAPGVFAPVTAVPATDTRENASARINFPQHITAGYSFRPTPDWNFEFDLDWTDWDQLDTVTLKQKSGNIELPFNWRSSFMYEFGVTRKFANWQASVGYIYSENSVPEASFNPSIPDSERHIFSAGVGQRFDHFSWDLAYQYSYGPERNISQGTLADGTYEWQAHALSLALGYRY